MKRFRVKQTLVLAAFGLVFVVWAALIVAPAIFPDVGADGGMVSPLSDIINNLTAAINNPLNITICEASLCVAAFFIFVYAMAIGIYLATRRNKRTGEEHGSAKWGDAAAVNRKYAARRLTDNKILTQNVRIGFDGHKHRRNVNVLICGGSGAGKTRSYGKPNVMNCNTSMVILDPKGEIARDTGALLIERGIDVKVLDLINMERSHCYNPLKYLENDNDVQRLVTNLFKATTPKNAQSVSVK